MISIITKSNSNVHTCHYTKAHDLRCVFSHVVISIIIQHSLYRQESLSIRNIKLLTRSPHPKLHQIILYIHILCHPPYYTTPSTFQHKLTNSPIYYPLTKHRNRCCMHKHSLHTWNHSTPIIMTLHSNKNYIHLMWRYH